MNVKEYKIKLSSNVRHRLSNTVKIQADDPNACWAALRDQCCAPKKLLIFYDWSGQDINQRDLDTGTFFGDAVKGWNCNISGWGSNYLNWCGDYTGGGGWEAVEVLIGEAKRDLNSDELPSSSALYLISGKAGWYGKVPSYSANFVCTVYYPVDEKYPTCSASPNITPPGANKYTSLITRRGYSGCQWNNPIDLLHVVDVRIKISDLSFYDVVFNGGSPAPAP